MIDRYNKEIKSFKATKCKKGIKYFGIPIILLKISLLKIKVMQSYKSAWITHYNYNPEGKKTVIGKLKKGINLKYFAALAIIALF